MKFLTYSFGFRFKVVATASGLDALRGLPEVAGEHVAMQVAASDNTFEAYEKFRLTPSSFQMYHLHGAVSQASDIVTLQANVRPSIRKVVSAGVWLALVIFMLGAMPSTQYIVFVLVVIAAVIWFELRMVKRATLLWQHVVRKTLRLEGIKELV